MNIQYGLKKKNELDNICSLLPVIRYMIQSIKISRSLALSNEQRGLN